MPSIRQLSPATEQELQQLLQWRRQSREGQTGLTRSPAIPNDRHIRFARTIIYPGDSVYADPDTTVIGIELGEYTFTDTAVADVTATFTAYSPQEARVCFFEHGWRPKTSIVRVTLHDGKWFCIDADNELDVVISEPYGIEHGASGDANVWFDGAVTDPLMTLTAFFTWLGNGNTLAADVKAIVRWDRAQRKWIIVAADCGA